MRRAPFTAVPAPAVAQTFLPAASRFVSTACFTFLLLATLATAADLRLADAIRRRDHKAVATLLTQHADVNAALPDGATPLAWAAYLDDRETAELLLANGASVKTADEYGETPLTLAAANANAPLVAKFLKTGADPNAPDLLLSLPGSPLATVLAFAQAVLQDSVYLVVFAWANTLQPTSINLSLFSTLYSWAIGLGLAALLAWALIKTEGVNPPDSQGKGQGDRDAFTGQAALLGVLGILGGGLPVWALGSQIIAGKWSDRYALAPMVGAVILLVCILEWLAGKGQPARKSLFLALLLGFSTAAQIQVTNAYRRDWQIQRDFYWQLSWRVPALKPGTAVLGTQMPLNYSAVYAIALALNLIYAPNSRSNDMPYWFIDAPRYHGSSRLPDYKENLPVRYAMRNMLFQSNTSQALVVDYNSGQGCVYVMSPDDALRPGTSEAQAKLLTISHLKQIETGPAKAVSPPTAIFGAEPFHDWCYYYEKADLARQMGDWQQIANLDQAAGEVGYTTKLGVELAPFIEGYAHLGQWQKAYGYTQDAMHKTGGMQPFLCQTWEHIIKGTSASPEREKVLSSIEKDLNCSGR